MGGEYPFLEVTKPDGTQYTINLENIITKQTIEEIYITIGRQSNNHIVLPDPQKKISRHHCSFQNENC